MQDGLRPLGRERGWLAILLVPTLIGLAFGTAGSIIATVILSLLKWDLISPPQFVGLQNFVGLLKDQLFLKSITVTVSFALLYVPGTMILSLLVALLLNRKLRGTSLFRRVYFLPVVSSAVAVGLVWSWIYAKDAGLLNYIITNLGGEPVNWLSTRNALYSVVIVNIWGARQRNERRPMLRCASWVISIREGKQARRPGKLRFRLWYWGGWVFGYWGNCPLGFPPPGF